MNDKKFSIKEPSNFLPIKKNWSIGMGAKGIDPQSAHYILREDLTDEHQQVFTISFYKSSHSNENCIDSNTNNHDEITFYIHFKKQLLEDEILLLRIDNSEVHGQSVRIFDEYHQISDQKIKIINASHFIPITVELSTLLIVRDQLLMQLYYQDLEYELLLELQSLKYYLKQRNKKIFDKANSDVEELLAVVGINQENKEIEQNGLRHWQELMDDLEKNENPLIPLQAKSDQLNNEERNFKN